MTVWKIIAWLPLVALTGLALAGDSRPLEQKPNTWVKRSPVKGGPVSPGMGYEASLVYDPQARRVIRWGGHNQGGGGEQNAETWVFDPATSKWALKEPNTSPPGVCCAQQNVFDEEDGRFLRFAAFSGNHGWQWFREIYLSNASVWSYDLAHNLWRNMRPLPEIHTGPLRCAAWDSDHQVAVVFGGEGVQEGTVVYDPYTNTWTRLRPKKQPAFRSGGNMAYDAARKRHILFGAQFNDDPHTWAYDLRKNEWTDRTPAVQPPANRNDAVLAYDPANKVIVAVVRAADRLKGNEVTQGHLETWVYDTGKNAWTRMKPPREPDGWRNRRRIMVAVPDQNLILMENFATPDDRIQGVAREQQMWTYRYAVPKADPAPRPPSQVRVSTTAGGAKVLWKPSPSDGVTGYRISRGEGPQPWQANFRKVGQVDGTKTSFVDAKLKRGKVYYYFVRAVAKRGESADSLKARTQPRVVTDAVVSMVSTKEAQLRWTPPPGADIVGYHIERAAVEVLTEDQLVRLKKDTPPLASPSVGAVAAVGPFQRLTKQPVKKSSFTDTTLDLTRVQAVKGRALYERRFRPDQRDAKGKPYRYGVFAYRIRAVNALGVEGGPSPYFLTIPSAPQWLFAREEGESCRLKWAANPEEKLRGYRVYRMEGPRRNGPGQPVTRVTADPIREPRYTDARAGKQTRRYYVVAVDALGQEGIPSAPAWHYREYRRYYVPFVGKWHQ
jgi:hypothetical protein